MAIPRLRRFISGGKPIQSLVYTLEDVLILSFSHDETLTEKLSLDFRRVGMSFTDPVTGNTASVTWDTAQQQVV